MRLARAFDLIIRGKSVVDGAGKEPLIADVGVSGNVITAIGAFYKTGLEEINQKHRKLFR